MLSTIIRRFNWFLPVGISLLAILASIPLVISGSGAKAWADITWAQSVGLLISIGVGLGWASIGATTVAGSNLESTQRYFLTSMVTRTYLAAAGVVLAIAILIIGSHFGLLALGIANILGAITGVANGVLSGWFLLGMARPGLLTLLDGLPRNMGLLLGAVLSSVLHSIVWFAALQLLGVIGSAIAVYLYGLRCPSRAQVNWSPRAAIRGMREGLRGGWTSLFSNVYIRLPLFAAGAVAPADLIEYSMADRLQKYIQTAVQPIAQMTQAYVPRAANRSELLARCKRLLWLMGGLSIVICACVILGMPLASEILSRGQIQVSVSLSILFGVATAFGLFSNVLGLTCLVALGRVGVVDLSTTVAGLLCIPLVFVLGHLWGALGIGAAVVISEFVVIVVLLVAFARAARKA